MPPVLLAVHAMATRFELVLHGRDAGRLRASGEEALGEIVRLERALSFYRSDSEVSRINHAAGAQPVRVSREVLRLLQACTSVHGRSDGAFDPTVGPLVRAWRSAREAGRPPAAETIESLRRLVGMQHLVVDAEAGTVHLAQPGMSIDLGSAGKGFAIDAAMRVLHEHGVGSALLHGGTSSVHVIGAPPGDDTWRIAWPAGPVDGGGGAGRRSEPAAAGPATAPQAPTHRVVALRDAALSVSAPHGRLFEHAGETYGHVLDPRTGRPVRSTATTLVTGPSSFLCDALSTALLVHGPEWIPVLRARWPGYEGMTA